MDCMMGMDCGVGMMAAMGLFWLGLLALVGWGLYRLVASRRSGPTTPEPPRQTLDRRYALGEISSDDYEERRRTLGD